MRSTLLVSAFAALAVAAPRPQEIEFDLVDAAPDAVIVTPPTDLTVDNVAIVPVASAVAAATAAVTDVASAQKRDFLDVAEALNPRDNSVCKKQPAGTGPAVIAPADDPSSFLAYQPFIDAATNAANKDKVPQGYSLAFSNLKGSSQIAPYLGLKTLTKYDPIACASYCDQLSGCVAFNLYYERDPTVDPNDSTCLDPPSLTNIKCVRWGANVAAESATNMGQWRGNFNVVIAGSNGYNKNAAPSTQDGFTGPKQLGGAINAPLDPKTKTNTYMGYKFFSFLQVQTFANGVEACTAACTSQTNYNSRHPPAAPAKPAVCNQVVVYVLSDENQPQGIYCSMYTEAWAPNYATNYGQYRGDHYWSVSQAYSYVNSSYKYPEICDVGGCPGESYGGGNCGGWGLGTC